MLLALAITLTLAPQSFLDEAEQTIPRFEGAAFTFDQPEGLVVNENSNGQFYILDAMAPVEGTGAEPDLKIISFPSETGMDEAALVDALIGDFSSRMEYMVIGQGDVTLTFLGAEHAGKEVVYGNGESEIVFQTYAFRADGKLCGAWIKFSTVGDWGRESMRSILGSLEAKPWDAQAKKRYRTRTLQFHLPLMSYVTHVEGEGTDQFLAEMPDCAISVTAYSFASKQQTTDAFWNVGTNLNNLPAEFAQTNGVDLLEQEKTSRWVRDGIASGIRFKVNDSSDQVLERHATFIRSDLHVVEVNVNFRPESRDQVLPRYEEVLESIRDKGLVFGKLCVDIRDGFELAHNSLAKFIVFEEEWGTRWSCKPNFSSSNDQIWFDIREAQDDLSMEGEFVQALLKDAMGRHANAKLLSTSETAGGFLGETRAGLDATVETEGKRVGIVLFPVNLGERCYIAGASFREEDRRERLWILANLMGRVQDLQSVTDFTYQDDEVMLRYNPKEWSLNRTGFDAETSLVLEKGDFRLTIQRHLDAGEELSLHELREFLDGKAGRIQETLTGTKSSFERDTEIFPYGDTVGVISRFDYVDDETGAKMEHQQVAFGDGDRVYSIRADFDQAKPEHRAAFDSILSSLELKGLEAKPSSPGMIGTRFEFQLPHGFVYDGFSSAYKAEIEAAIGSGWMEIEYEDLVGIVLTDEKLDHRIRRNFKQAWIPSDLEISEDTAPTIHWNGQELEGVRLMATGESDRDRKRTDYYRFRIGNTRIVVKIHTHGALGDLLLPSLQGIASSLTVL